MFGSRLPTPRELLPCFFLGTLEARFLKILLKGVICLSVSEDLHIDDDVQVLGSGVGRDGRRQGVSYVKAKLVALGRRSNCGYWWSGGGSNSRPSHCERDALPAELPPRGKLVILLRACFRRQCNLNARAAQEPDAQGADGLHHLSLENFAI